MKMRNLGIALLSAILSLSGIEFAQSEDPSARVGRLNLIDGTVSFKPAVVDDWSPALLNYPLVAGDEVWADAEAKAEMHLGSAVLRLSQNSDISFLSLDDTATQIRLPSGIIGLTLRHLNKGEVFEIDTPNAAVTLVKAGNYRVEVGQEGDARITVLRGQANVTAGDEEFSVDAKQSASIPKDAPASYTIQAAPAADDFTAWCALRDRNEVALISTRYVSGDMVGVEDLDHYGTWITINEYGTVWQPASMPEGWAPYSQGHWVWVEPWGWTWVDSAPWGFAPFHYGRWYHSINGWVWIPGTYNPVIRPVYSPGLVVFVGGNRWAPPGMGGGGVAWVPLGPHEAYIPAYQASPGYIRELNGPAIPGMGPHTIVSAPPRYANIAIPGAMHAMPSIAFGRNQGSESGPVPVEIGSAMKAPVMGATATIAPAKESIVIHGSVATVSQPPAALAARSVVASNEPHQAPVSFTARQQALTANNGKPLDSATLNRISKAQPPQKNTAVHVVNRAKLKKKLPPPQS